MRAPSRASPPRVAECAFPNEAAQEAIQRIISTGWGGRDRTSEWRNQNPLDYSMISRRIWKKWSKSSLAISIACQLFPNDLVIPSSIALASANGPKCSRAAASVLKPVIPRVRPWRLSVQAIILQQQPAHEITLPMRIPRPDAFAARQNHTKWAPIRGSAAMKSGTAGSSPSSTSSTGHMRASSRFDPSKRAVSTHQVRASSDCKLRLWDVVYPLRSAQYQFCNHGVF